MSKNPLLSAPELSELITRTRVIGADSSLVVFGGGNTSAKGTVTLDDGTSHRVMWIKASGGDMATATESTFAPLDLDMIDELRAHQDLTDEQMVELVAKTSLLREHHGPRSKLCYTASCLLRILITSMLMRFAR